MNVELCGRPFGQGARIEIDVSGNSDTSGSPAYNQWLS
jgi:outer membrane protein OmpA-like peptidoglycan-associated protein